MLVSRDVSLSHFSSSPLPHTTQGLNIHIPGTHGLKCFGCDGFADGPRDESGSKLVNQETMVELPSWILETCKKGSLER